MKYSRLAVVASSEQLDALSVHFRTEEIRLFCDNPKIYQFLEDKGVPFSRLDEFMLRAEWDEINAWACERALDWVSAYSKVRPREAIDWASALFLFFSHLLAHSVKNSRYAEACLEAGGFDEVICFPAETRQFPRFSGNGYLNHFLREIALERKIRVTELSVPARLTNAMDDFFLKGNWRSKAKAAAAELTSAFFSNICGSGIIFASGSLKHLGSVIEELRRKGREVLLHDAVFHADRAAFTLRNGVRYWVAAPAEAGAEFSSKTGAISEGLQAARRACGDDSFRFLGRGFGTFSDRHILSTMRVHLQKCLGEESLYERAWKICRPGAVLTDEDYALRGSFLAAYFRSKNVPVYCVSHANMPFEFEIPEKSRIFRQSTTFVHSEYEKNNYARRGWDPAGLRVLGTPRYDRLLQMKRARRRGRTGTKSRILYCANTFIAPQSPDDHGYLGTAVTSFEPISSEAAGAVLRCASRLGAELNIKPHGVEGRRTWEKFLEKSGGQNHVCLAVGRKEDFFRHLSNSDIMVLSYWSTGIIDAAVFGIPVIFIDFRGVTGPVIQKFAAEGYCQIVQSEAELEEALKVAMHGRMLEIKPNRESAYYLGPNDARSSWRVAEVILGNVPMNSDSRKMEPAFQ